MTTHGLATYQRLGCRCDVCREAKSSYQRSIRQYNRGKRDAARAAGREYVAKGIRHGLGGYQYHSCRCLTCKTANAQVVARRRAAGSAP